MENKEKNEDLNGILEYEYKRVKESGILDFGIEIIIENKDYTKWKIIMTAPEDSDYNGGIYTVLAEFPSEYPLENPKFKFLTEIYHCNVDKNNELKVNWLCKGMKIDYILPRLLTLFYLQDPTIDESSDKCQLYNEIKEEFIENTKKNVEYVKKKNK